MRSDLGARLEAFLEFEEKTQLAVSTLRVAIEKVHQRSLDFHLRMLPFVMEISAHTEWTPSCQVVIHSLGPHPDEVRARLCVLYGLTKEKVQHVLAWVNEQELPAGSPKQAEVVARILAGDGARVSIATPRGTLVEVLKPDEEGAG